MPQPPLLTSVVTTTPTVGPGRNATTRNSANACTTTTIFSLQPPYSTPSTARSPTVTPTLAPLPLLHPEATTVAPSSENTSPCCCNRNLRLLRLLCTSCSHHHTVITLVGTVTCLHEHEVAAPSSSSRHQPWKPSNQQLLLSRNQICVFFIMATLTVARNTKPPCLIPLMVAPPSTCSNKTFSQQSSKLTNADLSPFFRNSHRPITSLISGTLICSHEHHYCHYNACLALSAPQQQQMRRRTGSPSEN
ncbi:hypothetical protein DEO72_LG11g1576 [Vigna unguiculata]|uniref:Uncharacterized protein n=1 Tax=Vigna unguiculata TaxID=3917 RepID=A0A4D6NL92_VIGUN|nr:hypothetical protein DEO72_LG11g1576 [Vigna unguiculata]